jgi:hypothetical protein
MTHDTWSLLATVAFAAAGAAVVAATILFFALNIGDALAVLSGRRSARGIADLRAASIDGRGMGTGRPGRLRSRSSGPIGSGRVHLAHSASRRRSMPSSSSRISAASTPVAAVPVAAVPAAMVLSPAQAVSSTGTTVMGLVGTSSQVFVHAPRHAAEPPTAPPRPPAPNWPAPSGTTRLAPTVALPSGTTVMGSPEAGHRVAQDADPLPTGTTVIGSGPPLEPTGLSDADLAWATESPALGTHCEHPDPEHVTPTQVVAQFRYTSAKESL